MIPSDDAFIEEIAKEISKNRLKIDAAILFENIAGVKVRDDSVLFTLIDSSFNALWDGVTKVERDSRAAYIEDARAAISTINLKLLTLP